MNYSSIRKMDISNGPGIRVSLFVSGCEFHCKNCFNSETWNFENGKKFTTKELTQILFFLEKDYIAGFSILGGEPLHPNNVDIVHEIVKNVRLNYPNKTIWLWTGFLFENLNEKQLDVVKLCDTIVDGQFIDELKDYKLKYRGSSNQRVIDIKKTFETNQIELVVN